MWVAKSVFCLRFLLLVAGAAVVVVCLCLWLCLWLWLRLCTVSSGYRGNMGSKNSKGADEPPSGGGKKQKGRASEVSEW